MSMCDDISTPNQRGFDSISSRRPGGVWMTDLQHSVLELRCSDSEVAEPCIAVGLEQDVVRTSARVCTQAKDVM
jgi:hypothetical protein